MTDTSAIAGGRIPPNPNTFTGTPAANTGRGQPVYSNANVLTLAKADAAATSRCAGLASNVGVADEPGMPVQFAGPLTLTTSEWDLVTGQTGGLTAGAYYYVSAATAGRLTSTAPNSGGQYVAPVGLALDADTMLIGRSVPIAVGG